MKLIICGICLIMLGLLGTGCQTPKQVTYLQMLTSTNATFVAKNETAYSTAEDRIYQFLSGELQTTAGQYDINTNLNLFILSVEDQSKLENIAENLYHESEADAQSSSTVQNLFSPTNSSDAAITKQLSSIVASENSIAANLIKLSTKPSLVDEAKFLGGYADGVYTTTKSLQEQAQASAKSAATNSVSKSNTP
jgi:hypothetical protein